MAGHETALLAREAETGLAGGQSLHHIFASRDDLPCSERSSCRRVENEGIDVAKMDLRKRVKHEGHNRKGANRREAAFYDGRTYADYLALVPPDEVDTRPEVVGRLRRERDGTRK